MKNIKCLAFAAGLALCTLSTAAQAAVIITGANVGQTFQLNYTGQVGGSSTNLISATQVFTFTGLANGGNSYVFSVATTNSSAVDSRLRSFGFDVTSAVVTGASSAGTYGYAAFGDNYPEGFGTVEVCFKATSNGTCTGGPMGLDDGQSGNTIITLNFASALSSITLDRFVTRFQSIEPSINGSDSGIGVPVTAVPEPASWAMLIAGMGFVGVAMRRRKTAISFA